jgi:uncharacterized protein (DUF1499 family)
LRNSRFLPISTHALALLSLGLFAVSVFYIRMHPADVEKGLKIFRISSIAGFFGLCAGLGTMLWFIRKKIVNIYVLWPAISLVVCTVMFISAQQLKIRATKLPRIHDITTDIKNPPQFLINKSDYAGKQVAIQQQNAYPDLQSVTINRPIFETFQRALQVADLLDWQLVAQNPGAGVIEATETSKIFGFKENLAIRLSPLNGKTKVDVRSTSQFADTDFGMNAATIRFFLNRLERQSK